MSLAQATVSGIQLPISQRMSQFSKLTSQTRDLNSRSPFIGPQSNFKGIQITIKQHARHQHTRRQSQLPHASLQDAVIVLTDTPARDVAALAISIIGARALIVFCELLEERNVIDQVRRFGFVTVTHSLLSTISTTLCHLSTTFTTTPRHTLSKNPSHQNTSTKNKNQQILSRKIVHTLAGPGLLVLWPLFSAAPYARIIAGLVPILNGIRLLLIGNGIIKDEKQVKAISRTGDPRELLRGPLYYVAVLLVISLVYWRDSPVGLVVASLMCGGDGLADIVGRRLGKNNKLPWNQQKSWAGSLAMFFGGFSMAMGLIAYYAHLGYIQVDNMGVMGLAVGSIAFVATVIESLPINQTLDDNLSVPGVAAFLGIMFLQVGVELL